MRLFLILISLLLALSLKAQQYKLSGRVVDSQDNTSLPGSTIMLVTSDQNDQVQGTAADERGRFSLFLSKGDYTLKISFMGYQPFQADIRIDAADKHMGPLKLQREMKTLEEVQVTGQATVAIQLGDTTQFNAQAFKVNPDANAENLIEKLPGVRIQDGRVQAQGEEVRKVLVDGKPFFGEDPSAALKNIPAEIIDKIQIFDERSEQARFTGFDDGQTTKTVNIITRLEFRNGRFGRVYGGYGSDERYSAGGVVNFFDDNRKVSLLGQTNNINQQNFTQEDLVGVMSSSGGRTGGRGRGMYGGGGRPPSGGDVSDFRVNQRGGLNVTHAAGINYTDTWGEKIDVTGSYFFNNTRNTAASALYRQYVVSEDGNQLYTEEEKTESDDYNHRANLRIEYRINENNTLLLSPKLSFQQNEGLSFTDAHSYLNNAALNSAFSDFFSNLAGWNIGNEAIYRHKFKKEGRTITVRMNQEFADNVGESNLYSLYSSFAAPMADTIDQQSELDLVRRTLSGNLMYTEPLADNFQLMVSGGISNSFSDSDKKNYLRQSAAGNYSVVDSSLSNVFYNVYQSHEAGAGIRYNKRNIRFMIRMSYQEAYLRNEKTFPESVETDRSFTSVLPMAMFMYRPSRNENFRVFYRTSTSAPSIDKLQDVTDNTNPLRLTTGNPALKQQYQNMVFLRYSYTNPGNGKVFFGMIRGTSTNNFIGNQILTTRQDTVLTGGVPWLAGSQLIVPVNLSGYYSINSLVTYGFPVEKIKSNLNLNVSGGYTRTPGMIGTAINHSVTPSWGVGISLSSNISEKLDFTLSSEAQFSYTSNTISSQLDTRYFNQQNKMRIYWNFWKSAVFRTDMSHIYYTGLSEGYNEDFLLWNMGLGYKFMKDKLAEINLMVYDVFEQNRSISRLVTESYIEDQRITTLQRYFMINFVYHIRMFRSNG